MGPIQYAQHLATGTRLPFTAAYFGTIALTMYFAVGVSQKFLTDFTSSLSRLSVLDPNKDLAVCISKCISFAKT